jgi:hypothetical protein
MAGDMYARLFDTEERCKENERRIEELERILVVSNGARIILNGDLRVNNSTTLDG